MTKATPKKLKDVKLTALYRFGPGRVRGSWYILLTLAKREGWDGNLNGSMSGARAKWQQRILWLRSLAGGPAAYKPGGPSRHETKNTQGPKHWQQAVDVSDPDGLVKAARKLGVKLHSPHDSEDWHIEAKERFDARKLLRRRKLA